jgi:hypothetical protein
MNGDESLEGTYQVHGKYRDRVEVWGPYDDPQNVGFSEGMSVYSVTYKQGQARKAKWHRNMVLTPDQLRTLGWRKITEDDPATW